MSIDSPIRVSLEQESDYTFRVTFDDTALAPLLTDEPAPPAIANCMAASLLFSLRKFRNSPGKVKAQISATPQRNADGRWRIGHAQVELLLAEPAAGYQQLSRILEQFENFCIVTQSVRDGVDVQVTVRDGTGAIVHGDAVAGAQT